MFANRIIDAMANLEQLRQEALAQVPPEARGLVASAIARAGLQLSDALAMCTQHQPDLEAGRAARVIETEDAFLRQLESSAKERIEEAQGR